MKKSRYYLVGGMSMLMMAILSSVLIFKTLFAPILTLGLMLVGTLVMKKGRKLENIEQGRPVDYSIPVKKSRIYFISVLYLVIFIIVIFVSRNK